MFGLVLVAAALGLSNFAAAIGIGLAGVDATVRWRVGIVFGVFEAAMPLCGLLLGNQVAGSLGSASSDIGAGLLVATGVYTIWQARRTRAERPPLGRRVGSLITTAMALSIDNLVVGFALGTYEVPLVIAITLIAIVSIGMSLVGLELGARLGRAIEVWSEEVSGAVLIAVGLAIAVGLL